MNDYDDNRNDDLNTYSYKTGEGVWVPKEGSPFYGGQGEPDKQPRKKPGFISGILVGAILAAIFISVGIYAGRQLQDNSSGAGKYSSSQSSDSQLALTDEEKETILSKIDLLLSYIEVYELYDQDKETLIEGIYKGLVNALDDDYAEYMTVEELEEMIQDYSGTYYGIGVQVLQDTTTGIITIANVYSNSPARESGIEAGDIIYEVEGEPVTGVNLDDVVSQIKGYEGTTVNITLYRESTEEYIEVDVERRDVEQDVVYYEMLEGNIGYVQLTTFHEQSLVQMTAAIQDLKEQGMERMVLDLRNNTGGLLTSVTAISDLFLDEGTIVTVKDKYGVSDAYTATAGTEFTGEMTVLVNGWTASAAELLTGVLKDYELATVVGTTTYGKGIVQTSYPLPDGSSIKVTDEEYFTPSGNNIHGIGIEPDVVIEPDSESESDNQLEKAIEILNTSN